MKEFIKRHPLAFFACSFSALASPISLACLTMMAEEQDQMGYLITSLITLGIICTAIKSLLSMLDEEPKK